jgi:hypothetical protein
MNSTRSTRWPLISGALAAATCSLAIGASPEADERFGVYKFTAQFGNRPWKIVEHAISTIPRFIQSGNFRPLGRVVEWSGHDLAGQLSIWFNIPINISLGLLRMASAAFLAYAVCRLIERVVSSDRRPADRWILMPAVSILVASSFLVADVVGPVNMFSWFYLGTSAVVVMVAAVFTRAHWYESGPTGALALGILGLLGIALAAMNELSAIAIPLSLATILSRLIILEIQLDRDIIRLPVLKRWFAMLGGFLTLFIPVRLIIARTCSLNECYGASDFSVSSNYPATVVGRLMTGFVPTQWSYGLGDGIADGSSARTVVKLGLVFGAVVAVPVLWYAIRVATFSCGRLSHRAAASSLIVSGTLAFSTAAILGTSSVLQNPSLQVGAGWRDSALTTPAMGVVLATALTILLGCLGTFKKTVSALLDAGIPLAALYVSILTTWSVTAAAATDVERQLNNRIALEAVVVDETAQSNASRCELLELWSLNYRDSVYTSRPEQLERALDGFVKYAHGVDRFCEPP